MLTGKTTNKLMIKAPKKRKANKKVVVEDTVLPDGLCGTRVNKLVVVFGIIYRYIEYICL